MAVGPGFLLEFSDNAFAGADDALFILKGGPGMGVGEEVEVGLADDFVGAAAAEIARMRGAEGEEARVAVLEVNEVGDVLEEDGEEGMVELRAVGRDGFHGGNQAASEDTTERWTASILRRASSLRGLAR